MPQATPQGLEPAARLEYSCASDKHGDLPPGGDMDSFTAPVPSGLVAWNQEGGA